MSSIPAQASCLQSLRVKFAVLPQHPWRFVSAWGEKENTVPFPGTLRNQSLSFNWIANCPSPRVRLSLTVPIMGACVLSPFSQVLLCSLPGSSVHGILQARTLQWVAMPCSRGASRPKDSTRFSRDSHIAGGFFITEPPGKPLCQLHERLMTKAL